MKILAYFYDADEEEHPHTEALRGILKMPGLPKSAAAACRKALREKIEVLGGVPDPLPPDPDGYAADDALFIDCLLEKHYSSCPTEWAAATRLLQSINHWADHNGHCFYELIRLSQCDYNENQYPEEK